MCFQARHQEVLGNDNYAAIMHKLNVAVKAKRAAGEPVKVMCDAKANEAVEVDAAKFAILFGIRPQSILKKFGMPESQHWPETGTQKPRQPLELPSLW